MVLANSRVYVIDVRRQGFQAKPGIIFDDLAST
jgi:hypothetical protein